MSLQKPSVSARAGAMLLAFTTMCGNAMADSHTADSINLNKKFNLQIQRHPVSAPNDYSNPRTIPIDCNYMGKTSRGTVYMKPEFIKPFDSEPFYKHFRTKGFYDRPLQEQIDIDRGESLSLKAHLGSEIDKNHEICGKGARSCPVDTAQQICIGTPQAMSHVWKNYKYNQNTNTYELAPNR